MAPYPSGRPDAFTFRVFVCVGRCVRVSCLGMPVVGCLYDLSVHVCSGVCVGVQNAFMNGQCRAVPREQTDTARFSPNSWLPSLCFK